MIKRLRRQFILVAMLSTLAVLAVIIGVLNIANYVSMNRKADAMLDILEENGGMFPKFFMGREVDFQNPPEHEISPGDQPQDHSKDAMNPPKNMGTKRPEDQRFFSSETPYETRFFSVSRAADETYKAYTGQIVSVSEEEALSYAEDVFSKVSNQTRRRGNYKNFRYVITQEESGESLVVFLDISGEKRGFRNVMIYSLILSGVGLLAVFILVRFFSKKVFRPVEESDRKQKQFITDASHELKTPLTIISANVDVLEMESEESEWSKSIKNQVKRMNGLVEQMVTLSRLDESSEPETADFSLSDAVRETAESYLPVAEKNSEELTIDVAEGISFCGDEKRIRQMVGLLVENATKYCASENEEKGRIRVSLNVRGKKKIITVFNTTKTMEAGNKDVYFERFYRPDESRNSEKGGAGIGLSIVKSIAEAHKGSVGAKSTDGKSICFEVTL